MLYLHVGACALNQTPLDWPSNIANIRLAITKARGAGVQVLCLPELCITGYDCEDAFLSHSTGEMALTHLNSILFDTLGMVVTIGLPYLYQGKLYNTVFVIQNGNILGIVPKKHLPRDGVHYEVRWFTPWPQGLRTEINIQGQRIPFGDYTFGFGDIHLGLEICEDAWVTPRVATDLSDRAVNIILNPSASHFAFGKFRQRRALVLSACHDYQVAYVLANQLGNSSGRVIYDGDMLIGDNRGLVKTSSRFSFEEVTLLEATVEIAELRVETHGKILGEELTLLDSHITPVSSHLPSLNDLGSSSSSVLTHSTGSLTALMPLENLSKEEEFGQAVALGLFDYLRKSRSNGFVISLSGGADSAACACLVYLMYHLAICSLGFKTFKEKLAYANLSIIDPNENPLSSSSAHDAHNHNMSQLLLCCYQATANSGEITKHAAVEVAKALGATFVNLEMEEIHSLYINKIEKVLDRKLTWDKDDLTLQNIQARIRAPSIWMFANIRNALLLATCNRSEAAVGYTTMDGDTSGGLSPIAGIDKAYLLNWLTHFQYHAIAGIGPVGALEWINNQKPTAELRPLSMQQSDEADLMPYALLDQIERLAILDKLSPKSVFIHLMDIKMLEWNNTAHQPQLLQLRNQVKDFFTRWSRNQWKRERYAPSFHLDDENLDPKTWCRFPILSGRFVVELAELDVYVNNFGVSSNMD